MTLASCPCSQHVVAGAYIEPIDVLVPVLLCDGLVGDVRLLRVVLGVPVWL